MNPAEVQNNLGIQLRRQGKPADALAAFDRAIALEPKYADPHINRGNALRDLRRLQEADAAYRRAIALNPNHHAAHGNLANVLLDQGKFDDAIAEYRIALKIQPNSPGTLNHLSHALRLKGQLAEAEDICRQSLKLSADAADTHLNLGNILHDQQKYSAAIESIKTAIKLQPTHAIAHNNLAMSLSAAGQIDQAIDAAQTAVRLAPNYADGFNGLALILADEGQYDSAADAFKRAIQIRPDFALAHWNYSAIPLLHGEFETGWAEHEWRKKTNLPAAPTKFSQPEWTGQDITGKTILIHAEQGYGDTMQFARYVPMVASRGPRVLLLCPDALTTLFRESFPAVQVVTTAALPDFDFHCPLLSLPYVFQTRMATIPSRVPYLNPPPQRLESWKTLLDRSPAKLRVGLAWSGNPNRKLDTRRSLDPQLLSPLFSLPNIEFISLQKESGRGTVPLGGQSPYPPLGDFADTAALIQQLDLVISVDTAVAHLAGALAKPVWVLLSYVPAWRWMLDRNDSPWYPTMRLFRQHAIGDWTAPIAELTADLHAKLKATVDRNSPGKSV